jgi:Coenzyme PQQ synthesis protein D (PqqD)
MVRRKRVNWSSRALTRSCVQPYTDSTLDYAIHDRESPGTGGVLTENYPKHIDDLDINPADDGYIIYQPDQDRVHYLNPTAVFILELCNGRNSVEEIVELLQQAYGLGEAPEQVVQEAIAKLKAEGLLL